MTNITFPLISESIDRNVKFVNSNPTAIIPIPKRTTRSKHQATNRRDWHCLATISMKNPLVFPGNRKRVKMMLKGLALGLWLMVLLLLKPRGTLGFDVGHILKRKYTTLQRVYTRMDMSTPPIQSTNGQITCETSLDMANRNQHATTPHDDSIGENDNCHRNETPRLLCPSSHPSKTFSAPNLEVSYQSMHVDGANGEYVLELLPLQKYHARTRTNTRRRRHKLAKDDSSNETFDHKTIENVDLFIDSSQSVVNHDIPSLDFIYENQSLFQITKSSQVLLEEYHAQKQKCQKLEQSKDSASQSTSDTSNLQKDESRLLNLLEGRLRSKIRAECRASLPLSIRDTLRVLYCDSHICVVNKPSGVLSVPGHRRNPSLADLVYETIQPSSCSTRDDGSIDDIDQSVVHRLDMATSGIIVYALSKEALQKLHVTFRDRKVQKIYQALVEGHLLCGATEGEIDVALERDPNNPPYMRIAQAREEPTYDNIDNDNADSDMHPKGNNNSSSSSSNSNNNNSNPQKSKQHKFWREAPKPSKTTWSILSYEYDHKGNPLTRVALKPHTGRTHQLRVHTSSVLGTPIVGDDIYGSGAHDPNANLCLHAHKLCIHHPITGAPMVFEADPPF